MPVYVDDIKLNPDECTPHFIVSFDALKKRSLEFLCKAGKRNCTRGDRVLYVSQREYATVAKQDNTLSFIGSGDATTCSILVLISENAVSVGHFDGSDTKHGVLSMIAENEMLSNTGVNREKKPVIMAHIFGGFDDDKNISRKLLEDILLILSLAEQEIHLITACVWSLNSKIVNGKQHPIIYGVAIDIKSSQIMQATFDNKGPCEILRHARIFGGSKQMISIYDNNSRIVVIGPFIYQLFRGAEMLLSFDDKQILQNLSTSPHCEPDDFTATTRKAIQFLLEHPAPEVIFKNWKKLSFKMNEIGDWIQHCTEN